MQVSILGKRWNLIFRRMKDSFGLCESIDTRRKRILLDPEIKEDDERFARIVLHEILHAANWHLSEEFVDSYSHDAAKVLIRLGFRQSNQRERTRTHGGKAKPKRQK